MRDACKRQGMKIGKKEALACVKNVEKFFLLGRSFSGHQFLKSSSHKVVEGRKQQVKKSIHEENIDKYADSRCDEDAAVISCDEVFAKEFLTSISETYLLIEHADINSKSFSKELGNLFLSDSSFSLFMETSNLSQLGHARLKAILEGIKSLFDNRVRVILYGDPDFEAFAEKRFSSNDLEEEESDSLAATNKEKLTIALKERDDAIKDKECITKELQESLRDKSLSDNNLMKALHKIESIEKELRFVKEEKDAAITELSKSKTEFVEATGKIEELVRAKSKSDGELKENKIVEGKLRCRLQILEERNTLLETQINASVKDVLEVAIQTDGDYSEVLEVATQTDGDYSKVLEVATQTDGDYSEVGAIKTEHKTTQTKHVNLTSSGLTNIVMNLERHAGVSDIVERVYRCIRNFSTDSKQIHMPDGRFQCIVKVTKGRHVVDEQDLLKFEGYGETMYKAKEAAFNNYIDKIKTEAEKEKAML